MRDLDKENFEKYMLSIDEGRPKCFWCKTHILQGKKPILSEDEQFQRSGYTYHPIYEHEVCREAIMNALQNRGYIVDKS